MIDPWNPYKGPFLSEFLFASCCVCYIPEQQYSANSNGGPMPSSTQAMHQFAPAPPQSSSKDRPHQPVSIGKVEF